MTIDPGAGFTPPSAPCCSVSAGYITGLCAAPALARLSIGLPLLLWFAVLMFAGMRLQDRVLPKRRISGHFP